MSPKITVKEVKIDEVVKVSETILDFADLYSKSYFEDRCKNKDNLLIVAYDKFSDGSFYCWFAGVNPLFRKMGLSE